MIIAQLDSVVPKTLYRYILQRDDNHINSQRLLLQPGNACLLSKRPFGDKAKLFLRLEVLSESAVLKDSFKSSDAIKRHFDRSHLTDLKLIFRITVYTLFFDSQEESSRYLNSSTRDFRLINLFVSLAMEYSYNANMVERQWSCKLFEMGETIF